MIWAYRRRCARQAALLGGELQRFFAVELGLADEFFDAVGQTLCRNLLVFARRREPPGRSRA